MLADEKTAANMSSRKPLKRFAQAGEKVMGSSLDSSGEVKPLKDDIFMLEKTDYSSGSSIHEDSDLQHRRQSQFQRNGSSSLVESEHVVPAMRSSAQKVQQMNRIIGPFQHQQPQHVSRGNGIEALGKRLSRSSRVQQYLDKAYKCSSTEMGTTRTTSSGGSPHSRSSSSESSAAFELAHEAQRAHASLHSNLNHRYHSPFSW